MLLLCAKIVQQRQQKFKRIFRPSEFKIVSATPGLLIANKIPPPPTFRAKWQFDTRTMGEGDGGP